MQRPVPDESTTIGAGSVASQDIRSILNSEEPKKEGTIGPSLYGLIAAKASSAFFFITPSMHAKSFNTHGVRNL